MHLNFCMVLFLSGFSLLANSSELVRAGQTNSPSIATAEASTTTSKYEPFFDACRSKDKTQKADTIEAISPIKYGVPQIVQSDEKGQSAFDLINEAYKTAHAKLKKNLEQAQSALSCLDEVFEKNIPEISSRCHKTSQDVQEATLANQRARYALAIALPSQKVLNELQYKSLNTELNTPVTSFKVAQWNPLSVSENEFVSKTWDNFMTKTDEEVIKNIQNEMENIKRKQNSLVLNPKKQVGAEDLFILNYQTTEDVLSGQPKYC